MASRKVRATGVHPFDIFDEPSGLCGAFRWRSSAPIVIPTATSLDHFATESVRSYFSKYRYGTENNPCPSSLSKERCEAARKLMDTYLVDFEWSEAQHIAGLEFAKKIVQVTTL